MPAIENVGCKKKNSVNNKKVLPLPAIVFFETGYFQKPYFLMCRLVNAKMCRCVANLYIFTFAHYFPKRSSSSFSPIRVSVDLPSMLKYGFSQANKSSTIFFISF